VAAVPECWRMVGMVTGDGAVSPEGWWGGAVSMAMAPSRGGGRSQLYACLGEMMSEIPARTCLETCETRSENENGSGLGCTHALHGGSCSFMALPMPAMPHMPHALCPCCRQCPVCTPWQCCYATQSLVLLLEGIMWRRRGGGGAGVLEDGGDGDG
jgi:hypothetical protein